MLLLIFHRFLKSVPYNINIAMIKKTLFLKKRSLRENAHTAKICSTILKAFNNSHTTVESPHATVESCRSTMKSCRSTREQKYEENGRILHNLAFV